MMFRRKRTQTTVVSSGTIIEGNIHVSGLIHVDGRLEGCLDVEGDISVGPDGVVVGEVIGHNVTVAGRVEGSVHASGHLCLLETGIVGQEVAYETLEVRTGGRLDGHAVPHGTSEVVYEDATEDVESRQPTSILPQPVGEA